MGVQPDLYVYTMFGARRDRPLVSMLYEKGRVHVYPLWMHKCGRTVAQVEEDQQHIAERISSARLVMLNDFKRHLMAFQPSEDSKVLDPDLPPVSAPSSSVAILKLAKQQLDELRAIPPSRWHGVRAKSCLAYAHLETRGFLYGYSLEYPTWDRTWSGRSRVSGLNVQGHMESELTNPDGGDFYVNFDWVAADLRAAALLSKDQKLAAAFQGGSDPYKPLVRGEHSRREQVKMELLRALYSLDASNSLLGYYPGLRDWVQECRLKLCREGCLSTILAREFHISEERSERSVINAMVQGSVAHAMQLCLWRVWKRYPANLFIENHDSLVLTGSAAEVRPLILRVVPIMTRPFEGILEGDLTFPVRVSVGRKYRKWRFCKRYDG